VFSDPSECDEEQEERFRALFSMERIETESRTVS